jgi:hypothetical protein
MEYIGKETFYNYKLTQTEQICLVGLLSMILEGKELPELNGEMNKMLTNLRDGFSK